MRRLQRSAQTDRRSNTPPQAGERRGDLQARLRTLSFDDGAALLAPKEDGPAHPSRSGRPVVQRKESEGAGSGEDLGTKLGAQVDVWKTELTTVTKEEKQLDIEIALAAGSDGDALAKLEAKKAELELKRTELTEAIVKGKADVAALNNPATSREQRSEIEARRGRADVAHISGSETSTSWEGSATGVSKTTTTTGTRTTAGKTETRTTTDKKSFDGAKRAYTREKATTDDTSSSSSASTIGLGEASRTRSESETNDAGDKTTKSTKRGLERGGGKAGYSGTKTEAKENADGSKSDSSTTTKGGIMAGKDGLGVYGGAEASKSQTSASGIKTGVTTGLDGHMVLNVAKVPGSKPPKYEIKMSIGMGGKLGGTVGGEKTGVENVDSKGSVGVTGEISGTGKYSYRRILTEEEAKAYLAKVEKAKKGKKVEGAENELAILSTGASQGWDAAKAAARNSAALTDDPEAVKDMAEGEKVELALDGKAKGGLDLSGDSSGLALGIGGSLEKSTGITGSVEMKNKKVVATITVRDGEGWSVTGKGGMGAVGAKVGRSENEKTSRTLIITIDPKNKNFAALYAEFKACRSQGSLVQFAKRHPELVTGQVTSEAESSTNSGGLTVAGLDVLGAGTSAGTSKKVTINDKGERETEFTGDNTVSGNIGPKTGSEKESLKVKVDAKGKATGDLSEETKENDLTGTLKDKAKNLWDDPLGTLTGGGKKDKETTQVSGYLLTDDDFKRIMAQATSVDGWAKHANLPRLRPAWFACRKAILAAGGDKEKVAAALTAFMGDHGHGRYEVLETVIRGVRTGEGGIKYEFPDGLGSLKAAYSTSVLGNPVTAVRKLYDANEPKAALDKAKTIKATLDKLFKKISACSTFKEPAAKGEMLRRVGDRQLELSRAVKLVTAKLTGEPIDPEKLDEETDKEKYDKLFGICQQNKFSELKCFKALSDKHEKPIEATTIVNKLRELYVTWKPDHEKLCELAMQHKYDNWKLAFNLKPDQARFNASFQEVNGSAYYSDPHGKEANEAQAEADSNKEEELQIEEQYVAQNAERERRRQERNESYLKSQREHEKRKKKGMIAFAKWKPLVEAAKTRAYNAAGMVNGLNNRGETIKPAAQGIWSKAFMMLKEAMPWYRGFQDLGGGKAGAHFLEGHAPKVIAKFDAVRQKFHEGNQAQRTGVAPVKKKSGGILGGLGEEGWANFD